MEMNDKKTHRFSLVALVLLLLVVALLSAGVIIMLSEGEGVDDAPLYRESHNLVRSRAIITGNINHIRAPEDRHQDKAIMRMVVHDFELVDDGSTEVLAFPVMIGREIVFSSRDDRVALASYNRMTTVECMIASWVEGAVAQEDGMEIYDCKLVSSLLSPKSTPTPTATPPLNNSGGSLLGDDYHGPL